ncbi:MAG: ABC transporter permease [Alphaproteobacteria bacterium]|nr:ABC transporter permease [Alphaproteobacteria bacterium]
MPLRRPARSDAWRCGGRLLSALGSAAEIGKRIVVRKTAALSLAYLVAVALAAAFATTVGFDPLSQNLARMLEGPSRDYLFGTDELGRDILARVVYGARTSLITAAGAVTLAASVGVPMGLVAGFFGGWRDAVLMRIVDLKLALPSILLALALIAVLGRSQVAALTAVGLTGVPTFARVARAQVLSLRRRDFVTAVEAFGASSPYLMFRTILPNSWSPILTQMVVLSSVAILLEASLAFLGVGIPPPTPSWGEMLRTGKEYLYESPTYAILPGLMLTLTILSFDTLGRALSAVLEGREDAPVRRGAGPA